MLGAQFASVQLTWPYRRSLSIIPFASFCPRVNAHQAAGLAPQCFWQFQRSVCTPSGLAALHFVSCLIQQLAEPAPSNVRQGGPLAAFPQLSIQADSTTPFSAYDAACLPSGVSSSRQGCMSPPMSNEVDK